jgi:NADH dehydrogenase
MTHGYYRAGDFIYRQGEVARAFCIVEEGEVEVLEKDEQTSETNVVAILGKGDFFGEEALLENRPHEKSIRARTPARLTQIGSELFSQIAGSFAPLRELMAKTMTHSGDFWRRLPLPKSLLEGQSVAALVDPLPAQLLNKQTTLADAIKALNESDTGQLLVLDENQRLWGTLDRTRLYNIIARIAVSPTGPARDAAQRKLVDLLPGNAVYVALDDSAFVASATMLDHELSWLPVVQSKNDPRPVGFLRGDRISQRLIQQITQMEAARAAS